MRRHYPAVLPGAGAALIAAGFLLLPCAGPARAGQADARRFGVEIEAGPVWQGMNDIEIPNDGSATRIAVEDVFGKGPASAYRIYLSYDFSEKHGLRALFAPLTIEGDGTPSGEIRFDGEVFPADVATRASYRFNSYRLTYRYRLHDGASWRWHAGFTAKVRDAEVIVSQASREASYDNVGFVPLLHLAGEWMIAKRWFALFDADALAAPQGRAEDVALKLGRRFADGWSVAAGYRMVEGGADNDEVYTFAWLHYAVASVRYAF